MTNTCLERVDAQRNTLGRPEQENQANCTSVNTSLDAFIKFGVYRDICSQSKGDASSDDRQQFLSAPSKRRCKSEGVILLVGKLATSCWVRCCDPGRRVDNISPSFAQLRLGWMVAVQMSTYVWISYQRIGDAEHRNA